jgi:hypothetical protein
MMKQEGEELVTLTLRQLLRRLFGARALPFGGLGILMTKKCGKKFKMAKTLVSAEVSWCTNTCFHSGLKKVVKSNRTKYIGVNVVILFAGKFTVSNILAASRFVYRHLVY